MFVPAMSSNIAGVKKRLATKVNTINRHIVKQELNCRVDVHRVPRGIHVNRLYEGKVKNSRYSQHETRDKRPLGRDPVMSWCHCHTSVKLSWSQPVEPWTER